MVELEPAKLRIIQIEKEIELESLRQANASEGSGKKRQEKLLEAYEVQRFFTDTDKAISWVNERSIPLSTEDCGRDLTSVQALQGKHEALERDLTALDEKIVQLGDDTKALTQKHPESQDTIQAKYDA
ncbi:unnamed protein product [Trichobilharzia regenti]|nr:unnamed protein product [Trichobilharzia regenti]